MAAVSDLVRINGLELYGDGTDMTMAETTQAHNTTRRRLYRNEDMDDVSLIDPNRMNVHFLVEITLDMLDDEVIIKIYDCNFMLLVIVCNQSNKLVLMANCTSYIAVMIIKVLPQNHFSVKTHYISSFCPYLHKHLTYRN